MFHHASEHPEGKHVEKQVHERTMKELIGDKLEQVEIGCHEEMQTAPLVQVNASRLKHHGSQIGKHIDDEQVLGDDRYVA